MHSQVREFARLPLSLLTRLRLILFGHEDLAGIVFWAALIGICGALTSVAFREGVRLLETLFTGQSQSLVHAASDLVWWHRALVPPVGGLLAGLVLHLGGRAFTKVYRRGESVYSGSLTRAVSAGGEDDWRLRTVGALVKPAAAVVSGTATLEQMFAQLPKRPATRVYVTAGDDLVAWLDPRAVLAQLKKQQLAATATVASIAQPVAFTLAPDMPLSTALEGFLREQVTVLPVTPGQWRGTLLGEVSRHDLLLAIQ